MEWLKKIWVWFKTSSHFKHLLGGLLLVLVGFFVPYYIQTCGVAWLQCIVSSWLLLLSVAVTWEYNDKRHGGAFDWQDIWADVLGGAIATGLVVLFLLRF